MKRKSIEEEVPVSQHTDDIKTKQNHQDKRKIVVATHLLISMYALCYWIQIGVMPYLTRSLGVDAKVFGYLQSIFAFVQLCGGPIFGRFGDLFGGKYALILAFSSCFLAYGLLAVATNIPLLFLSRLPSVVMHSMQGAQMVITDVTTNEERAGAIGQLGISYGVGMVLGPLIGGFVTDRFNEQVAATVAMLGSAICIIVVMWFIPVDTKRFSLLSERKDSNHLSTSVFDFKKYASIFKVTNFTYLFFIKIVSGLPIGVFQAMFSIFAMDFFKLNAKDNGMVLSYVGITGMIVQGVCVPFLTKRFGDTDLIKYSVLVAAVGYILLTFVSNIYMFLVVLSPLICGGSVLTVIITSVTTKIVPSLDTGAALGLSMATNSFIRTISPTIGGILYTSFGFPVFGILGALVNGLLTFYLFLYGSNSFFSSS